MSDCLRECYCEEIYNENFNSESEAQSICTQLLNDQRNLNDQATGNRIDIRISGCNSCDMFTSALGVGPVV